MPPLHAIAHVTALRFVDSLVEGTLVGIFAAVLLRAVRRHSSGARFAVSFAALMAIALLPFIAVSSRAGISAGPAEITLSESWAFYLFIAWTVIAAFFLMRLVRALWHLHHLRRSCTPIDVQQLDPLLQETIRDHRSHRQFDLCISDAVRVPTALGLLKPAVVIPSWVLNELSTAELNQILLHELAHLRRWDDWTNLAQQLVRTVFFFHPAVWWIDRRIALEREMACDEAVLAITDSPRAYAECLARMAEKSFVRRSVALAQAALGKIRHTSLRVTQILNVRPSGSSLSWKPAVSLVAGFAIVCGFGVSRAPRLIAFHDSAPGRTAAQTAANSSLSHETAPRAPAWSASLRSSSPLPKISVIPAKLSARVTSRNSKAPAVSASVHSKASKPASGSLVHLAASKTTPIPVTETVFFVIESGNSAFSGHQVYQIQMWRVTVLHLTVDPDRKSPPKTT